MHKSFHFFQRVFAESVLHEKYKPRYAENFEQTLDLWTKQKSLLFLGKKTMSFEDVKWLVAKRTSPSTSILSALLEANSSIDR